MTDITLVPVTTGNNLSATNSNFTKVQDVINDDMLHVRGGNNTLYQAIDMNSNKLLNVPVDVEDPKSLISVGVADERYVRTVVDSAPNGLGYVGGRYYAGETSTPAIATTTLQVTNVLTATPFIIRDESLWTRIGVNVPTAVAGGKIRLGIYKWFNGEPTDLILDAGEISTDTPGIKELSITVVLPPGVYGMASLSNAQINVTGFVGNAITAGYTGTSGFGVNDSRPSTPAGFGALPNPFGPVSYVLGAFTLVTLRRV